MRAGPWDQTITNAKEMGYERIRISKRRKGWIEVGMPLASHSQLLAQPHEAIGETLQHLVSAC